MKFMVLLALAAVAAAKPHHEFYPRYRGTSPYIVGGEDSAKGRWPWQLSLEYYTGTEWFHTCGAVLISERYALTAAHCTSGRFPNFDWQVVLGAFDRDANDEEDIIAVTEALEHDFNAVTTEHDICILTLERDAVFSEYVDAVDVPLPGTDFVGNLCYATGWGLTDGTDSTTPSKLQEVEIDVITNEECSAQLSEVMVADRILDTHICINDELGEKGACSGDSGGPLNCDDTGTWYVAGVTSWGVGEGGPGGDSCLTQYPSVYTRVSEYYDWIMENITP